VTAIDLFNDRILETVEVGLNPSGGAVLPGDIDYAVVVRGEDRIAFINTASRQIVGSLTEGIGASPFSLVVAPNGRLAFVNNTASHDISVIDLAERRVIERIPVPETPIVMAVHPSGRELWVSSEGVHRLTVISIPEVWRGNPANLPRVLPSGDGTEVAVMGMIHSGHPTSDVWGLPEVEETIRRFEPDVLCAEIAPDRWETIDRDLRERDVIEDPRVLRFPEYTDLILRLSVTMGFAIEPCAGWSLEMSDLRVSRIAEFERDARWAGPREEYARRLAELQATYAPLANPDDPAWIHSDGYDERQKGELALYDEYQNDLIGPGGWTNINVEHYREVDRTIREHRGARILVTFGGGHKYWLLERLRERDDITLLELADFLPG
jgi:YVTN family beta-propeller protein